MNSNGFFWGEHVFISIKYKLFTTLLIAVVIVVVGMFLLIHWSFNRGFLNYVNTVETKRLESLAVSLQKAYTGQKDWRFLQGNTRLWYQFLVTATPEGIQQFDPLAGVSAPEDNKNSHHSVSIEIEIEDHESGGHQNTQHLTPLRKKRDLFEFRVVLMDRDRNVVVGPSGNFVDMKVIPLKHDSVLIGYLGHIFHKNLLARHQLQFVREQKKSLAVISLLIAVLAAVVSFPVATRMVRRINALAGATHSLAAGKYELTLPEGAADELGQLTRDFNILSLTLKKNETIRKQWVADISHELRTPIAILRGEIEALQDGVRPVSPEAMQSLHAEILQLGRIVDDLFQLSLSDVGALTYRKKQVEVVGLLEQATDIFRSKFAQKEITLSLKISTKRQMVLFADPERLHQLFNNLLMNSLKYTDVKGNVKIICSTNNQYTEIIFEDSSPGVPKKDIGRLFERLFRVESSRSRVSGGAGLGLAVCKNIVEAHGGVITAEPSPLGGLLIRISLLAEKKV